MSVVQLDLGPRSYNIIIGQGAWEALPELVAQLGISRSCLLVTNPVVDRLYGRQVRLLLEQTGLAVTTGLIPDGEEAKTLAVAGQLLDQAVDAHLDRRGAVIALGGGVVGDVAGLVAALYLRGVPFIQLPTTLLAQVDSSVGGKVAVNHPLGKNLIGAFYQPKLVVADLSTLATLPRRELVAGLAEVIKYGVIWDEQLFTYLEANLERLLAGDAAASEQVVGRSCAIKARVVELDEREEELRAILNFGHTVGHGLEAVTGYNHLLHGEAVAIGMAAAGRLAETIGLWPASAHTRLENLIQAAGLPVTIPAGIGPQQLLAAMGHDKKKQDGQLLFILPEAIGRARITRGVTETDVVGVLRAMGAERESGIRNQE